MQNQKIGWENVKQKLDAILIPFAALGAIILLSGSAAPARARSTASTRTAGRQAASSQSPGPASGEALAGTWKLNRALSDDPAKKLVSDDNIATGETGTAVPMAGQMGGRPDATAQSSMGNISAPPSGMSGIGGLGGPNGMGGGVPPMPATPPSHRWDTDKDRQKRLEGILPANSLTIEQKDNEIDIDDLGRREILYTDARKLRKSKDDKIQEYTARWEAGNLTYDEKRPPRGTITRAFELSLDGHRMTETMTIDNGSISVPVVLKYVYDAATADAQR
jgi:hypothetical protein